MCGTAQGVPVKYMGYFYSVAEGSIQVITVCPRNMTRQLRRHLLEFLNGFIAGEIQAL